MKKKMNLQNDDVVAGKPFLKWAGGKRQLLNAIAEHLPNKFAQTETFIEPFVGSGAMVFWILTHYPQIKNVIINDVNTDLIYAYQTIKDFPEQLIQSLMDLKNEYESRHTEEEKRTFFMQQRELFNLRKSELIEHTALFIFLNRTCFNGLYRVNSRNLFNVPFGKYKNPTICDENTIRRDSKLLQKVTLLNGDYSEIRNYITPNTFVYFDPPYKPVSKTSNFNSYSSDAFNDNQQIRLYEFCHEIDQLGVWWLLSNSDPQNNNPDDSFFDELYKTFFIKRVDARRNINAQGNKRGIIKELLISNYKK